MTIAILIIGLFIGYLLGYFVSKYESNNPYEIEKFNKFVEALRDEKRL